MLFADAAVDLFAPGKLAAEMAATGFTLELTVPLGIVMLVCALVYAVPTTSVLGGILIAGFAGVPSALISALVRWGPRRRSSRH